jgi:hypothetical protein
MEVETDDVMNEGLVGNDKELGMSDSNDIDVGNEWNDAYFEIAGNGVVVTRTDLNKMNVGWTGLEGVS